jgi:hypothetical protein
VAAVPLMLVGTLALWPNGASVRCRHVLARNTHRIFVLVRACASFSLPIARVSLSHNCDRARSCCWLVGIFRYKCGCVGNLFLLIGRPERTEDIPAVLMVVIAIALEWFGWIAAVVGAVTGWRVTREADNAA